VAGKQRRAGGGGMPASAACGHDGGGDAADDGDGDGDAAGGGGQPSSRGVRGLRAGAGGYKEAVGADVVILAEDLYNGGIELVTGGSGSGISVIRSYNGRPTVKVVVAGKQVTAAALAFVAAVGWRLVNVILGHQTPVFVMNAENFDGSYGGHPTVAVKVLPLVPVGRLLNIAELPEFAARSLSREKENIEATFVVLAGAALAAANASSAAAADAMTAFEAAVNGLPAYERPPSPLEGAKIIHWKNENAAATLAAMPTVDVIAAAATARTALDALRRHIPYGGGPTVAMMAATEAAKSNKRSRARRGRVASAAAAAAGGGGDESADSDGDESDHGASAGGARKRPCHG
jgi:hypothetical protein